MRIAVSGTHFIGKTTLIEDFLTQYPMYKREIEPYYQLLNTGLIECALEPSLDNILVQLDFCINQLNNCDEQNVIFDRCPIDFIVYAMCNLHPDKIDINETQIADQFEEIKLALKDLDLIIFLPISSDNHIDYTEENPAYRKLADKYFKQIYRDDILDIFPSYNQPKIIEITGPRMLRIKKISSYLY